MGLTFFVALGDLLQLREVDVGRQVDVAGVGKQGFVVFHQLVLLQASERVGEGVVLAVVDHQGHAAAQLENIGDVLHHVGGLGTQLVRVPRLQILLGRIAEEFFGLKLNQGVVGGAI